MKKYGMLMPVSSLPSRFGIGDFGSEAFNFVKLLNKKKFVYWQILPLNPLGPGWSPYMSICSNAIDFRYISLDKLVEENLLNNVKDYRKNYNHVDFLKCGIYKEKLLKRAFINFKKQKRLGELNTFIKKEPWVKYYSIYLSLTKKYDSRPWHTWNKEDRDICFTKRIKTSEFKDYKFNIFVQYIAYKQWSELREFAHLNHIEIIGDVPFYCGYDSLECWMNRDLFDLDDNYVPKTVGGFPPDYFSEDGQLWGNPCYNFKKNKEDKYKFLSKRIGSLYELYDVIRLDHFLGFNQYYAIPYGMKNARIGEWVPGPKKEFFQAFFKYYKGSKIIAEDLGLLTDEAIDIRDTFNLPGMNVIQFSVFDRNFKYNDNQVVYTATHDSDTLLGWFKMRSKDEIKELRRIFNLPKGNVYEGLLRYTINFKSALTMIMYQDYYGLDNKYRVNFPGTLGSPNWEFRVKELNEDNKYSDYIDKLIRKGE